MCFSYLRTKSKKALGAILWSKSHRLVTCERLIGIQGNFEFLDKLCNHNHTFNLAQNNIR